jgi:putative PEP-CTERM system TPR-repeat lipoprotein
MARKIRMELLAAAGAVVFAGCPGLPVKAAAPDSAAAEKYVAEADQFLAKNDLKSALVVLKNAEKADPANGAIRTKLGGVELRLNDLEAAQIDLKAAKDYGGDKLTIIPLLGRAYALQGKFADELEEFPEEADAPLDIRVETLAVRANAQMGLNQIDAARASLTEAEKLKPMSGALKFALANLDMRDRNFDVALKRVDEAMSVEPSADAHYLKAQILIIKHDPAGAMSEVNAAIALDPDHVGALIQRTQLLIDQGQDAKADIDVKALLKIAPQLVPARYFQALLLSRARDYGAADTILTKYTGGFKAFPQGYLLHAMVKMQLRQYEAAETAINAYLAPVPDDPRGRKFQARILMSRGDFPQAAKILENLTDERPDDAEAFTMLGEAYAPISEERSAEAYAKAVKLTPDDPSALRGQALGELIGSQPGTAIEDLEKVVKLSPDDAQSGEALAMAYIDRKRFADADKLIAELVRKRPDDPVVANMVGLSYLAQSRVREAATAFEAVGKKFPDFIPSQLELAKIYESLGDRDRAKSLFDAVIAKHPENVAALQGVSPLYVSRGQTAELLNLWKKSYRLQPDNLEIELGVIRAYIVGNDLEGALTTIRDMQVRQPKEPELYRVRAALEVQKGAFKDAIDSFQRVNELQPGNPATLRQLALAQEKAGDIDGALKTIAAARKLDPTSAMLALDEVRFIGVGNREKAIASARQFAELLPEEPAAQALEGDYLMSVKLADDALEAYRRAMQAHPSLYLAERISGASVAAGRPQEGEKILSDWVAAHPQDLSGRMALVSFLKSRKNYAAAKEQYEILLKDQPDNAGILNNLALICQLVGDPRALDFARRASALAPDNPQVTDTLGWIMARKDAAADGLTLLRRAHDLAPDDPDTDYHLAYVLNQTGKKADAQGLLKKALATSVDFESKDDAQALFSQLSN